MNKILELVIGTLLKKGVLYEGSKLDIDAEIPMENDKNIKVNIKIDRMVVRLFKEDELKKIEPTEDMLNYLKNIRKTEGK
jgi:hypothetical protein